MNIQSQAYQSPNPGGNKKKDENENEEDTKNYWSKDEREQGARH